MSELRELTGMELDAVGGGFLNNKNFGSIQFNNTGGNGGNGGGLFSRGGDGGSVVVGSQIGQQVNGIFSINGIIG
jgi:hypothetical protein